MAKLTITRGYPGSGKTTWADSQASSVRISRDDLRKSLFGTFTGLTGSQEMDVSRAQKAQVTALLAAGINVIVDDTNLKMTVARDWADIAHRTSSEFECKDFLVSAEECISNDHSRFTSGGRSVGEEVIRSFAKRYPIKSWKTVTSRNVPNSRTVVGWRPAPPRGWNLDNAIIVDVDGTVADHHGIRSPYEYDKVGLDRPHMHVINIVRAVAADPYLKPTVIVVSGRDHSCFDATLNWLKGYGIQPKELLMRQDGDKRSDDEVKYEIYDQFIRNRFNVVGVFDDRLRVSRMWHAIGLPLFRVGDPDANF